MKRSLHHWPLVLALVVLWSLTYVLLQRMLIQNDGHFVYNLDDPYIHMAIAKNIVQHGVFGVDKYHFSSSSSSLLWVACLALVYSFTGANEWTPFVLNVGCATSLLVVVYAITAKRVTSPVWLLLILLSIIFFTPLPLLIFTGLEHIAHATLIILCVHHAVTLLAAPQPAPRWSWQHAWLIVLAVLATLTRYESLFLIGIVCGLFFVRRQRRYAVGLALATMLPVIAFGIVSVQHGWYMLPNSVLLKGNTPNSLSLHALLEGAGAFTTTFEQSHITSVLVILHLAAFCWRYLRHPTLWDYHTLMLASMASLALAHMEFAMAGIFFRYEAYLIALGIVVLGSVAGEHIATLRGLPVHKHHIPLYLAGGYIAMLVYLPFVQRGTQAVDGTVQASSNIYHQQYQAAKFVQQFYENNAVAAIDIGALNFFADVQSLDLWGLGDMEPARLKRTGQYDRDHIAALAQQKQIKIAIVYDTAFGMRGQVPATWTNVGTWKITNNVICASDTIMFYAVDPTEAPALRQHLRDWSVRLPSSIAQTGAYLQ